MTGSRTGLDGITVAGEILPPEGAPIAVDWRLGISDDHYRIEDVAIAGVSTILTEPSEIAAQIARRRAVGDAARDDARTSGRDEV